ncbi:sister chromatid cohesion protein Dcc1 [Phakopsora pachyrhizi]|uniref:Sister chromatid cohesion protein Dcc1 n=1 Tax=Phakopsora pachyrhizi TaxID=170000 RepID=A0AAV0BBQ1_PHAPC|nr:sister chromatid cohesion protein Dcc1 [Phakopsora pachyrhizi]CAH7683618.1 sister chromatid cohesion protein Dcc1 [Phakopsora pachyrhizi]
MASSDLTLRFISNLDHLNLYNFSGDSPNHDDSGFEIDHSKTSYQLLQLPDDLLSLVRSQLYQSPSSSSSSNNLSFGELRGRPDDEIVLTTSDKTLSLRSIQNSNSVMICASLKDDLSLNVLKIVNETILLEEITYFPGDRLDDIRKILTKNHSYSGETDVSSTNKRLKITNRDKDSSGSISFSQLSDQVRASDLEILNYLNQQFVVRLDGGLRILSQDYVSELVEGCLATIEELSIDLEDEFELGSVIEIVAERLRLKHSVVVQVLNRFLINRLDSLSISKQEPGANVDDDYGYQNFRTRLDLRLILRLIGLSILRNLKPIKTIVNNDQKIFKSIQSISIKEFIENLRSRTFSSSIDQDRQESIFKKNFDLKEYESSSRLENFRMIYIQIENLSTEPKQRISQLFEIRTKFRIEEFKRFLRPLVGNHTGKCDDKLFSKRFDELMLKYCRKINCKLCSNKQITLLTSRNKW